ncbi:MAG: right-handed parallel beta-helix repeat-containing protein [Chlorobi bacterium]|nr:right-handed parallel beta-helix repeat-containing protein [Chlorobiota bacterium]
MKKLFTLIAIVLMGTANSFAYITVSDTLTSNETWTSGNTYFVSADFVIGNNNTLTIEQDVIVKFAAWTGLSTYSGELVVNGTSTNPVIFTSMNDNSVGETISGSTGAPSRGDWSGISIDAYTFWGFYWDGWTNMTYAELRYGESFYFDSTSDPDQGDVHASSLNHVFVHQFEYSGFEAHDTPLSVSYLDVSFCGYGMLLNFENTNDFSNIWISNIESPVIIDFTSCHIGDISYWNIEPQENQYIDVWYTIQDNSTLKNDVGLPYVLNNDIEANSLSVEEGSIVKLSGTLVIRDGTLDVNGSKDYPVIFTSYKDDEFGGDTNGDGNTTSPAKGDWTCVTMDGYYSDFAKGQIDWAWFRYGGQDDHGCYSNVEFWGSNNASYIYNSRIEYSERNGIDVYKCSPSIKNNTFLNNDSSDVRILDNLSQPILGTSSANKGGNIFRKNGLDILNTTTNTIPAKYNDWGSEDSTALSQRLGNNDPSTGDVNFYPWFGNEDDYWYTYDKTAIENAGVYNQLLIPYVDAPAGTAILYQTGEGRYGKMKILQRTMSTMTLWWETYNSDGSTYSAGTNLSLASSGDADLCELDRGIRGTYLNTQDDCEFYINADGSLLTMPGTKFLIVYSYCTPLVHSGSTSGNQTWGAGTHQISNDFTINGGDTLFIEPGAVVKFEMDKKLTVNGTLMALGTQSDSIWFTSANDDSHGCIIDGSTGNPQPGDWKYITHTGYNEKHGEYRFCDFAYGGTSSSGMLSYSGGATGFTKQCTIEKSSSSGLYVFQVDMTVDSCVFRENSNHGIEYNYYSTVRVNNSSFLNNGNYAVVTGSSDIEPCSNNYATGNNLNGMVIIALGTSNYQQLINYNSMPFIIYSTVYIGSGKSLHIGGGNGSCLIKMNTDAKIQLSGGHLHTFGTTFTSLKDDSRGGDTNNDGNATSPAPGDWQNIFIQYDHDAYLSQSHFYYGGSNTATIYFANGAGGNLDQIEVRYSEWNGVYTSSSPVDIWACDISENTKSGVYLYGNDSTIIRQSDIKNNGEHGVILAYGSSATITDNQIEGNAQYPIYYFGSSNLKSPITGNILEGNLLDAVVINSLDWYKKQRFFEITGNPSSVKYSYVFLNNTMIYSTTDTLEFNAGSVVKFNDHTYLQTKGAIIANNTVFTSLHDDTNGGDTENNGSTSSPSKGDWSYIEIDQGGVAKYDYCDVRYGGYNNYASVIFYTNAFGHIQNSSVSFSSSDGISKSYSGNVVIKDNTILGNNRYGINVYGTQDTLVIDGNTISQSGSHAVYLNSTISTDINNNTFENNAGYPVYYTGTSTINDPFTGNTSSGNLMEGFAIQSFNGYSNNKLYYQQDIPFIFLNNIISYSTVDTFQVESMATLKFFPDVKLEFRGPVITHGGIMTSIKDDAWGGDTNNDGDATVAAPGDWRGLELYNTWGEFNGFIIRYAGGGSTPALNFNNSDGFIYTMIDSSAYDGLRLYNGSNVEVDNSDFNGNARYGVNANSVDTLTISNCTVQGNGNHGIYNSYAAPALDNNTFTDNGGYPVYFASGSIINKPFTGNTSSGNLMEGFAVQSFNGYAHNILYHQDDIPFIFPDNIISYSTVDTFQIENATLKFLPDIELELRGPVIANGGVLTSIKDDTWDGRQQ